MERVDDELLEAWNMFTVERSKSVKRPAKTRAMKGLHSANNHVDSLRVRQLAGTCMMFELFQRLLKVSEAFQKVRRSP